ncbi:hypothetical protein ACWTV9_10270 [Clostridioides difficile]
MVKDIKKTVKFSQKEINYIEKGCKKKGVTFSHFIRMSVKKYLNEVLEIE